MATAAPPHVGTQSSVDDTRFFAIMAYVMAFFIVAGFTFTLAMGRSTFDAPWPYHLHGVVFMAWVGLYVAQHTSIASGHRALHARLGQAAYLMLPVMMIAGTLIMVVVAQRNGGPFFFHMGEFLISNVTLLWCFGGLTFWALRVRRHTGWHRRLMLCGMAIMTGPGIGRLLPAPLFIPNAWLTITLVTFIFPVIGIVVDWRKRGSVHPAYWWGFGAYVGTFVAGTLIGHSSIGIGITEWVVAGTPGAQRPIEAYWPEGFTM